MAEKDLEMRRMNTDATYTIYNPLTKATNVKMNDGTSVETKVMGHLADYVPFKDRTNMNILNLAIETEVLKGAVLTGITANIYIETFQDATDIEILQGRLIPGEGITG